MAHQSSDSGKPFAYKVQAWLIVVLLGSFVLIVQQVSLVGYQLGLFLLIGATLTQIPFGNIDPEADTPTALRTFLRLFVIVVVVFGFGIFIAPYLVEIGR